MSYIVFTDLDGTLLDFEDFSFEPAEPALQQLRARSIPLIIVTSKTLAEVAPIANALNVDGPIVIESGGALATRRRHDEWTSVALGASAEEIRRAVPVIEQLAEARLLLYSQMSLAEAGLLSGLYGEALRRSMKRQFDEPFILAEGNIDRVTKAADAMGLMVREGGRFHHLTGRSGKGDAVRRIVASLDDQPLIIALGDAPMDADFLSLADIPIIMRGCDGRPHPALLASVPHATVAPCTGPEGWARAVTELLQVRTNADDAYGPN
jgi:mannosyl-3-phosphoglycerate phosphatase